MKQTSYKTVTVQTSAAVSEELKGVQCSPFYVSWASLSLLDQEGEQWKSWVYCNLLGVGS